MFIRKTKPGLLAQAYNPNYSGGWGRGIVSTTLSGQHKIKLFKIHFKELRMQLFPSMHEALYSIQFSETEKRKMEGKIRQGKADKQQGMREGRTESSGDNQEGCPNIPRRPPTMNASLLWERCSWHCVQTTKTVCAARQHFIIRQWVPLPLVIDLIALWLSRVLREAESRGSKLADCGLEPACRHIVFCLHWQKKKFKSCQHLKIENALLKLQLLVNSVTGRVFFAQNYLLCKSLLEVTYKICIRCLL